MFSKGSKQVFQDAMGKESPQDEPQQRHNDDGTTREDVESLQEVQELSEEVQRLSSMIMHLVQEDEEDDGSSRSHHSAHSNRNPLESPVPAVENEKEKVSIVQSVKEGDKPSHSLNLSTQQNSASNRNIPSRSAYQQEGELVYINDRGGRDDTVPVLAPALQLERQDNQVLSNVQSNYQQRQEQSGCLVQAQALSRAELRVEFENELLQEQGLVAIATPMDEIELQRKRRRVKLGMMLFLVVVSIVGIIIGVVLGTSNSSQQEGNSSQDGGKDEPILPGPSPTTTVTTMPTTLAPTGSPTPMPTLSPKQVELLDYLKSISLANASVEALDDPTSPQHRAFLWLSVMSPNDILGSDIFILRYVLVTFYYALGGENWIGLGTGGWLTSEHPCTWNTEKPITFCVAGTDSIDVFDLTSFNLKGTLPDELGLLTTMRHLIMIGNDITGTIPSTLFQPASSLVRLELNDNNISGNLPSEIGFMPKLQELNLSGNPKLGGSLPTEIGNVDQLREILMNDCAWTGNIPSEIGLLTRLGELDIQQAAFSGSLPDEIGNMIALKRINLSGDAHSLTGSIPDSLYDLTKLTTLQLTGLEGTVSSFIGQLSKLQVVQLGGNQFTGTIPSEIGLLTDVRTFNLFQNPRLTGSIPSDIGNMTNLEILDFHGCNITGPLPTEMGRLSSLAFVNIAYNAFLTGTLPTEVGMLSNLEDLELQTCSISGTLPMELAGLSRLRVLNAAANQMMTSTTTSFSDIVTMILAPLTELETFGIGNGISGTIPPEVAEATNLRRLYLHQNGLTGTIPTEIGLLTSLTTLAISDNLLSGMLPPELSNINALEELHVQRNQFSGTIPATLGSLSLLDVAYFDGNVFAGPMPLELCAVPRLYADCDTVECPCCNYCCISTTETGDSQCVWNEVGQEETANHNRDVLSFETLQGHASPPN